MGRERRLGEGTDERNVCEKEGDGCETRKRERDGKGEEKTFTEEEKKIEQIISCIYIQTHI